MLLKICCNSETVINLRRVKMKGKKKEDKKMPKKNDKKPGKY